jgi:hypothetical protein
MHQLRSDRCSVDSDGDNGNHYGWCKKAKHWGTYKNGKSGDAGIRKHDGGGDASIEIRSRH